MMYTNGTVTAAVAREKKRVPRETRCPVMPTVQGGGRIEGMNGFFSLIPSVLVRSSRVSPSRRAHGFRDCDASAAAAAAAPLVPVRLAEVAPKRRTTGETDSPHQCSSGTGCLAKCVRVCVLGACVACSCACACDS